MIDLNDIHLIPNELLQYNDIRGMSMALTEATHSDHTTQVGAYVLGVGACNKVVQSKRYIGTYTDGREDTILIPLHQHAESLALIKCARLGIKTENATLYAPWASCVDCAMAIVAAGIRRVVVHRTLMEKTYEKYLTSVDQGLSLLYDNHVRVEMIDRDFGFKIRMNGKEVEV